MLNRKYIEHILESIYCDFDSIITDELKEKFLKEFPGIRKLEDLKDKKENLILMCHYITIMIDFMEENKLGIYESLEE